MAATVASTGGRKSNPFGDAKPVDTQSKLLQIEEIEKKERVRGALHRCSGPCIHQRSQVEILSRTRSEEQRAAPAAPQGGRGRGRGRGEQPPPPPEPRSSPGDGFLQARGARPPPPAREAKEQGEAAVSVVANKFDALGVDEDS